MKAELAKIHQARRGKKFAGVELEEGEIMELVVRRSRIGLVAIWMGFGVGLVVITILMIWLTSNEQDMLLPLNDAAVGYLNMMIFMMYVVLVVAGMIATAVYRANMMGITNKRVIQRTTTSIFAKSLNVIELSSVEDVSFAEKDIFDRLLRMGTVRLSTVGDETTYTLSHVDAAEADVKKIAKLVHMAKNRQKVGSGKGGGAAEVDKKA